MTTMVSNLSQSGLGKDRSWAGCVLYVISPINTAREASRALDANFIIFVEFINALWQTNIPPSSDAEWDHPDP